ncbi:MAG TPA: carbonic anhydrase, partial [Humisphaera sp.]
GHHGCGMAGLSCARVLDKALKRGVPDGVVQTLGHAGIDLEKWLTGFENPADGVRQSVDIVREHPLLPKGLPVHGLIMDPETGKLELLIDGYAKK